MIAALADKLRFFKFFFIAAALISLSACSTNPATGRSQFAALMSPAQELEVGRSEHAKIVAEFGLYDNQAVQSYVQEIGKKVTQDTERPDVDYKFFVLDTPMVNAFALPGGYIYVARGLLALANSEAELAGVLAHEAGHITGRHSAERYSRGVLTSLGTAVLSAAVDNAGVSQALGIGSDLYIKSYSRGQENEADTLGLRYMARAGYDTRAMVSFLENLQAHAALEARLAGQERSAGFSYFSTHPATSERVAKTAGEAAQYQSANTLNRDRYMQVVSGLLYGDSSRQGFIRGQSFLHPEMGFAFDVPPGFRLINQPSQVIATEPGGATILFDFAGHNGQDPYAYLTQSWMKGEKLAAPEQITVNGMPAATAAFSGTVNNQPMTIRLIAVRWDDKRIARFQMAIPRSASAQVLEGLKRSSYSFRRLSDAEKKALQPHRLKIVTAGAGDTPAGLAARLPFPDLKEERFRVLNGLRPGEALTAGRAYKIVAE